MCEPHFHVLWPMLWIVWDGLVVLCPFEHMYKFIIPLLSDEGEVMLIFKLFVARVSGLWSGIGDLLAIHSSISFLTTGAGVESRFVSSLPRCLIAEWVHLDRNESQHKGRQYKWVTVPSPTHLDWIELVIKRIFRWWRRGRSVIIAGGSLRYGNSYTFSIDLGKINYVRCDPVGLLFIRHQFWTIFTHFL